MITSDYLIVGTGLTGSVIARRLKDAGHSVFMVERRSHCAGNVFDYSHESGIRIHKYGPHFFRTSSDKIWKFVNRFSKFYSFEATVQTFIGNAHRYWPINESQLLQSISKTVRDRSDEKPNNFKEACLRIMPEDVFDLYIKEYTEKQWGVAADQLDAQLATRIEIRASNDMRLKQCRYQGIPVDGYTQFVKNLLQGIPILLNCDFLGYRSQFHAHKKIIYTGSIDEFYGYELGTLGYRTQKRSHRYIPGVKHELLAPVINNPLHSEGPHVRTIEWKQMMPPEYRDSITGTVLTTETPEQSLQPHTHEYPFPDEANERLYKQYAERAKSDPGVFFCGRLGEYRYLDMDQAIARALTHADLLLKTR